MFPLISNTIYCILCVYNDKSRFASVHLMTELTSDILVDDQLILTNRTGLLNDLHNHDDTMTQYVTKS